MARFYLHGLSTHGPFIFSNYLTRDSYSWPLLQRYDMEGQAESAHLWASPVSDRPAFEELKARLALAGMPLRPRAFR